jgi:hypothetical protein
MASKADFPLLYLTEFRAERLFLTERPRLYWSIRGYLWEICSKYGAVALLLMGVWSALAANAQISKTQEKINAQHANAIAAAQKAAEAWLKIEDAETYEKSWEAASDYFRSQVPEKGWVQRMETMRKAIDPVLVRDLSASEWKTEIPNLPKGEYVAFVYQTVFANGHPQIESVVMVREHNAWKMVGYAVQ